MERKAFLIGANTGGLQYAENDVKLIAKALSTNGYQIIIPQLIKSEVIKKFDDFIDDAKRSDFILFYFSGHALINNGSLSLVISDNNLFKRGNLLPFEFITNGFSESKAKEKLIILDCCNANTFISSWKPDQSDKYRILTASEKLELAKEIDEYQSSYLTFQISTALAEKPKSIVINNKISINGLYDWMVNQTIDYNNKNPLSSVPLPNLLGNQKSNFEIVSLEQIPENRIGKAENLTKTETSEIVKELLGANERLFLIDNIEFESLYDKNVKLYNQIYQDFFYKLSQIPSLREKHPHNLFNRILAFEKLEDFDVQAISKLRVDNNFKWYEKSLIVNALSLALINKLEDGKLNLLIDFLTDFEPKVWERAIVGIILCLKNRDELFKSYPIAFRRLNSLQFTPEIHEAIGSIVRILSTEGYSIKALFERNGVDFYVDHLLSIFRNLDIESWKRLDEKDISKIRKEIQSEILRIVDNEYNPLEVDYQVETDFFKKPQNWFLPFYAENNLVEEKLKDSGSNVDVQAFLNAVNDNIMIDDVDKYYLCLTAKEISNEDLKFINFFGSKSDFINTLKPELKVNFQYDYEKHLFYTFRIREYYKYINLFSEKRLQSNFKKRFDIYNSSLVNILSTEGQRLKILGDEQRDEGLMFDALELYCNAFNYDENNVNLLISIANCLYDLSLSSKALEVYKRIEELGTESSFITKRIALCYSCGNDYFNALKYFMITNRLSPDDIDSQVYIALYYFSCGEYLLAKRFFLETLSYIPNDFFINKKLGIIYQLFGENKRALEFFVKARKANSTQYEILLYIGDSYFMIKDYKSAIKYYLDYKYSKRGSKIKINARIDNALVSLIEADKT